MLCVIMNEDVREIRFENIRSDKYFHPKKSLKKYVPFQIPAVLAHYAQAVNETSELKVTFLSEARCSSNRPKNLTQIKLFSYSL